MQTNRWPGPVTGTVSVGDELAFDALPEETRMLAERVVESRSDAERLRDHTSELEWKCGNLRDQIDSLRMTLERIAENPADAVTLAKGALAA